MPIIQRVQLHEVEMGTFLSSCECVRQKLQRLVDNCQSIFANRSMKKNEAHEMLEILVFTDVEEWKDIFARPSKTWNRENLCMIKTKEAREERAKKEEVQ